MMSDDVGQMKKTLRRELLKRVGELQARRPELDEALSSRLHRLPELPDSGSILAFAPLPSEPQIDGVVDSWGHGFMGSWVHGSRVQGSSGLLKFSCFSNKIAVCN